MEGKKKELYNYSNILLHEQLHKCQSCSNYLSH